MKYEFRDEAALILLSQTGVQPRPILYTALGYVVLLQILISKYLDVTLPFKLEHRGSESFIFREESRPTGRDALTTSSNRFPLYHRGNEKEFRLGVDALNINIAYLCFTQSLSLTKQQIPQTLLNLRRLLLVPWLGRYTLIAYTKQPVKKAHTGTCALPSCTV